MRRTGFTLTELIVATLIVITISAILFPVFVSARSKAQQTSWIESMRQTSMASTLYMLDYDDRYMVARYRVEDDAEPQNDRTWVQIMLPYAREFDLFLCPADHGRDPRISIFDADIVPGDTYSRFYSASKRSNIGYNFLYLSPIVNAGSWQSRPRGASEISDPARTLLFGESAWEVVNGRPEGGGHFLVIPPCRYQAGPRIRDTFDLGGIDPNRIYTPHNGWTEGEDEQYDQAGGLYPWFGKKANVLLASGQVRRMSLADVTAGCDVMPEWDGFITDTTAYMWDIQ